MGDEEVAMTWSRAFARALVIVAYFVICTAWLPDRILRLGFLAESRTIGVVMASAAWAAALAAGIWALRRLQGRNLI